MRAKAIMPSFQSFCKMKMPRLMGTDKINAVKAESWRGERFFLSNMGYQYVVGSQKSESGQPAKP